MWLPWERDRLAVYADELQARGDLLGERISVSLAAETSTDPEAKRVLLERAAELDRKVRDPALDQLIASMGVYAVRRSHGVVVGLERVRLPSTDQVNASNRFPRAMERALDQVLGHRELQFVQRLEFPIEWFRGRRQIPDVAQRLVDRFPHLRPRVVRIGFDHPVWHAPARAPSSSPLAELSTAAGRELTAVGRGLLVVVLGNQALSLGELGVRTTNHGRAAQLDAALRSGVVRPLAFTRFARALWDDSRTVREIAYPALERLGTEVAAVIPDLLLLTLSRDAVWAEQVARALRQLGRRPDIVEATAPALDLGVTAHRTWLAVSARPEAAKLARAELPRP